MYLPAQRPLALLVVLVLLACVSSDDALDSGITASEASIDLSAYLTEEEALQAFRQKISDGFRLDKTSGRQLIDSAMTRGFWSCAEQVAKEGRAQGIDLSSAVHQAATVVQKRLSALTESLQKAAAPEGIPPAFQWAQSPESIFLNVKFAHKWDTPATLGCVEESVTIANSSVVFGVACKEKKKKFLLSVDLHSDLVPENSTWSMSSVGRAMFTLQKSMSYTWPRLLKTTKKPANMHVWWEMHERYEAENKAKDDEVKMALKNKKKEEAARKAAESSADASGNSTETEDATTATATPTPAPVVDKRKAAVEKEFAKKRKQLEAKHKEALSQVDSAARAQKKLIDDDAAQRKEAVEKDAAQNRTTLETGHTASKSALEAELAQALASLPPVDGTDVGVDDTAATLSAGDETTEL